MRTNLPIFKGYYGEEFGAEEYQFEWLNDLRQEAEKKPLENDFDFDYDYETYYNDLSQALCYKVCDILEDFIKEIKFINLDSPKYYNYSNDVILCDIKPNEEAIKKYIKNNYKNWSKYLKDNFTSYEGFFSYYSNDPEHIDWNLEAIFKRWEEYHYQLGAILDFIAINEGVEYYEIYEDLEEIYNLDVKNWNELLEMEA